MCLIDTFLCSSRRAQRQLGDSNYNGALLATHNLYLGTKGHNKPLDVSDFVNSVRFALVPFDFIHPCEVPFTLNTSNFEILSRFLFSWTALRASLGKDAAPFL